MIKDNGHTIYGTESQEEISKSRQKLKDEMNIIFGQLFALKLHSHGNTCSLYIEDDGVLHHKIEFNTAWIDDFEKVLNEFKNMLSEKQIKTVNQYTNNHKW